MEQGQPCLRLRACPVACFRPCNCLHPTLQRRISKPYFSNKARQAALTPTLKFNHRRDQLGEGDRADHAIETVAPNGPAGSVPPTHAIVPLTTQSPVERLRMLYLKPFYVQTQLICIHGHLRAADP